MNGKAGGVKGSRAPSLPQQAMMGKFCNLSPFWTLALNQLTLHGMQPLQSLLMA
jgi:hypothetical protein